MLNNKKLVAGVAVLAVIVVVAALWVMRKGSSGVAIDLISLLPDAQKASRWTDGGGEPFSVQDITLDGQTHKAIFAPPLARIRWKVEVPRRGTLEVFYALREDAWTADGNGAQFRVGVSDGRTYEEYLTETVNPKGRERDRRWLSATIDLSAYEGQLVELNFNTDHGPKNDANDKRNDFALWGDPKIVGR